MPSMTTIKLLGLAGAASYALARAAVYLRGVAWHRAFIVAVPRAKLPAMPRGYSIRPLTPAELAQQDVDVSVEQQRDRFDQGIACLGAFNREGVLTGLVWMSATGCTEGDVALRCTLPASAAWDTGMWIHPDHRMGRTFQALWAGVAEWLDAHGLSWSCSAIADYNLRSMGAHSRLGLIRIGEIRALRLAGWQWIAVGQQGWRMVRPPNLVTWPIPPLSEPPFDSDVRQGTSLAA